MFFKGFLDENQFNNFQTSKEGNLNSSKCTQSEFKDFYHHFECVWINKNRHSPQQQIEGFCRASIDWHHGSLACHKCIPCELDACDLHGVHELDRWGNLALRDNLSDELCRDVMDEAHDGVLSIGDIASILHGANNAKHRSASCGRALERICTHPFLFTSEDRPSNEIKRFWSEVTSLVYQNYYLIFTLFHISSESIQNIVGCLPY